MVDRPAESAVGTEPGYDIRFPVVIALSLATIAAIYYFSIAYFYAPGDEARDYLAPLKDVGALLRDLVTLNWGSIVDFGPWATLVFSLGILFRMFNWFGNEGKQSFAGNIINDSGTRNYFFELLLLLILGWLIWGLVGNATVNLQKAGIASGFGFLNNAAGFSISFAPFYDYSSGSTYLDTYLVGLQNTLLLAVIGIFLATILGFVIGIARLSPNWVISKMAYWYVEVLRNIPLLLQIFIWYKLMIETLPPKRGGIDLGVFGVLNNKAWFAPNPIFGEGASIALYVALAGIVATWILGRWAKKRQMETGQTFPVFLSALGLIIVVPLLVFIAIGSPVEFAYPSQGNFGPRGGAEIVTELLALLLALALYTAAFIAEIVRAGILAVNKGQTEAFSALGLTRGQGLRLVIIPQAMRVIIPPLTSQYLNLTKNSSLAVAIAYPDLTAVFAGTALNQTGQAVEILLMTMLTYLAISILTSLFMNWYNARMALVER